LSEFDPYEREDLVNMLKALTMAFMLFLSRQPNMILEFPLSDFENFPYEDYKLSGMNDSKGTQTFMLIREDEAGVVH